VPYNSAPFFGDSNGTSELSNGLRDPGWSPAAADSDFNSVPWDGCFSPQQLSSAPVIFSPPNISALSPTQSLSPASHNTHTPAPAPPQSSSPLDVSPRTCDHSGCHFSADNGPALAQHIQDTHPLPNSKRLFCGRQGCGDVKDGKALDRHLREQHFGERYTCRCGDAAKRKEGHRKHLAKCTIRRPSPFVCVCGKRTPDKEEHGGHLKVCRERPKGRPRKGQGRR